MTERHPSTVRRARTRRLALAAALLFTAACGGSKDTNGAPNGAASASGSASVKARPLAELLGSAPGPMGPLAGLKLGMTMNDAKAAAPTLQEMRTIGAVLRSEPLPEFPGVRLYAHGDIHTGMILDSFHVDLPPGAQPEIERAWGKAIAGRKSGAFWLNPASGLRALYKSADNDLAIHRYQPLTTLLGSGSRFAFESERSVFGMKVDEVRKAFGRAFDPSSVALHLLPTEYSEHDTTVFLKFDENAGLKRYDVYLKWDAIEGKDAILAALEKRWGKPTSEGVDLLFQGDGLHVNAELDERMEMWRLQVAP